LTHTQGESCNVLLGEWFVMLWRSMTFHRKEMVMWMWNREAFGDIYIVTFQKNIISYTAVQIPMFAMFMLFMWGRY
jgi:hypothetical protein